MAGFDAHLSRGSHHGFGVSTEARFDRRAVVARDSPSDCQPPDPGDQKIQGFRRKPAAPFRPCEDPVDQKIQGLRNEAGAARVREGFVCKSRRFFRLDRVRIPARIQSRAGVSVGVLRRNGDFHPGQSDFFPDCPAVPGFLPPARTHGQTGDVGVDGRVRILFPLYRNRFGVAGTHVRKIRSIWGKTVRRRTVSGNGSIFSSAGFPTISRRRIFCWLSP